MAQRYQIAPNAKLVRSAKDVERILVAIWRRAQALALDGVSMRRITEALSMGDASAVLQVLGWDRYGQYLASEMGRVLGDHYREFGDWSLGQAAGPVPTPPKLSVVSNAAVDFMREFAASRVVSITEQTRAALRTTVEEMQRDGIGATRISRMLGESVGLFPRWARAVENYRRRLEEQSVSRDAIERNVRQYKTRLITARGLMIARTERAMAANAGTYDGWIQAAQLRLIDPSRAQIEWLAGPEDFDTCECFETDGKLAAFGTPFPNGFMRPPAHPNCTCSLALWPKGRRNAQTEAA